ncbi:MAG: DUF1146 family protein [Candidatus Izemoplasma sp.]
MDNTLSLLFEIFIFFITLTIMLQVVMAIDTTKIFKRNSTWQIQIFYIFGSIIFAYLFSSAIVNLINISVDLAEAI